MKRVTVQNYYGTKWGVRLDGKMIGTVQQRGEKFVYYGFPMAHIDHPAKNGFRALLACVKSYTSWVGNHGRI